MLDQTTHTAGKKYIRKCKLTSNAEGVALKKPEIKEYSIMTKMDEPMQHSDTLVYLGSGECHSFIEISTGKSEIIKGTGRFYQSKLNLITQ